MEISALYRPSVADFLPQQSDAERAAWLAERCGKLTASNMHLALDFKRDGTPSLKRSEHMRALLAERLTGLNTRNYVSPAMEWGSACEPEAKLAYMRETGIELQPSRFYDHPTIENCGATPDAEIGEDGLAEFKCPTTTKYIEWVTNGTIPAEHKPQMLLQLACTGRKWVEFVAFDPRLKDETWRLFIRRYRPKPEEIGAIEAAARTFLDELDAAWEAFTTA